MPKTFCEVGRLLLITCLSCIQRREQIDFGSLTFGWIYRIETLFNSIARSKRTWRRYFRLVLNWRSMWAFIILSFCQLNGMCAYCETDVMSHVSFKTARHHCFFRECRMNYPNNKIRILSIDYRISGLVARGSYISPVPPCNTRISKTFSKSR